MAPLEMLGQHLNNSEKAKKREKESGKSFTARLREWIVPVWTVGRVYKQDHEIDIERSSKNLRYQEPTTPILDQKTEVKRKETEGEDLDQTTNSSGASAEPLRERERAKGDIGTPEQRKNLVDYLRKGFRRDLEKINKRALTIDDSSYANDFFGALLQIAKNIEEFSTFYSEARLQRELEQAWNKTKGAKYLRSALGGSLENLVEKFKQSRFDGEGQVTIQAEQNISSGETEDIWLTSVKGTLAEVATLKIPESLKQAVQHLLSDSVEQKELIASLPALVDALPESDQKYRLITLVNVKANKDVKTLRKEGLPAEEDAVVLSEETVPTQEQLAVNDYTLAVDFESLEKQHTRSEKARDAMLNLGRAAAAVWSSSSAKAVEYTTRIQDAVSTGAEKLKQTAQQTGETISNSVSATASGLIPPDFRYAFTSGTFVDGVGTLEEKARSEPAVNTNSAEKESFDKVSETIQSKSQGPFAVLQSKLQSLLNRTKQAQGQEELTNAQKYDEEMSRYKKTRAAEIRASKISPETLGYAISAKIQKARELDPTKSIAVMNELREVMAARYKELLASDSPESALKKASEENRERYQAKLQEALRLYDMAKIDTQIMNEMKQMSLPASLRGLTTGMQELKKSIDAGYMEVATGKLAEKALASITQIRAILNNPNIKLAGSVGAAAALAYMAGHYMGAQEVGTTLSTPPTP